VPVYVVGPATARSLESLPGGSPLQLFGAHTGSGEVLATYILQHYAEWWPEPTRRPPLLFVVGEQRRDVIPRLLMNENASFSEQIKVEEVVVYATHPKVSFENDLRSQLDKFKLAKRRWIVVFSPMGCEAMLRCLEKISYDEISVRVVAIGPTTRDHLYSVFGFEAAACAATPTPEGLLRAILDS